MSGSQGTQNTPEVQEAHNTYSFGSAVVVIIVVVAAAVVITRLIRRSTSAAKVDKHFEEKATIHSDEEIVAMPAVDIQKPAPAVPVIFAARLKVEHIKGNENLAQKAPSLFSEAEMRWTGPTSEWEQRIAEMGLDSTGSQPPKDEPKAIILFSSHLPLDKIPNNRSAIHRCLSNLLADNDLKFEGFYKTKIGVNITRYGFEEF